MLGVNREMRDRPKGWVMKKPKTDGSRYHRQSMLSHCRRPEPQVMFSDHGQQGGICKTVLSDPNDEKDHSLAFHG